MTSPFCARDPNYTPPDGVRGRALKGERIAQASLSAWHLVFVPTVLNYILAITAGTDTEKV